MLGITEATWSAQGRTAPGGGVAAGTGILGLGRPVQAALAWLPPPVWLHETASRPSHTQGP